MGGEYFFLVYLGMLIIITIISVVLGVKKINKYGISYSSQELREKIGNQNKVEEYDKAFELVYARVEKKIESKKNELNSLRKKLRDQEANLLIIVIVAAFLLLIILLTEGMDGVWIALGLLSIFIMAFKLFSPLIDLIAFKNKPNKPKNKSKGEIEYTNYYKENIITPFLKELKCDIEYKPNEGLSKEDYNKADFKKQYQRYSSADLMNVVLKKKYSLSMAEVLTEIETVGNQTIGYEPLFWGVVVKSELKKSINSDFFLRDSYDDFYWKSKLNADKVIMDSVEFEKTYEVYSSNKIVAMQILTADIMQMLLEFKEKTGIRFDITIKNNQLYIQYLTGPIFEIPATYIDAWDRDTLYRYYLIIKFSFKLSYKIMKILEENDF